MHEIEGVFAKEITTFEVEADSSSPLGESDMTIGSELLLPGPGVPVKDCVSVKIISCCCNFSSST